MSDLPAIKYLDTAAKAGGSFGSWKGVLDGLGGNLIRDCVIAHARTLEALAEYEPEPVDEDADIQAVRNILHAHQRGMTPPDSGWGNMSYAKGSYDNQPWFSAALAQYKAERPTITDDEALLIAREICAKVYEGMEDYRVAKATRWGTCDHQAAAQFAFAMVKRDPAALEAFRGVGRG